RSEVVRHVERQQIPEAGIGLEEVHPPAIRRDPVRAGLLGRGRSVRHGHAFFAALRADPLAGSRRWALKSAPEGGISSPSRGGSLPTRDRIASARLRSAGVGLPRKRSAVRSADSFSATATFMNWFTLVPSSAAILRTAFRRDVWSRSG